MPKKKIKELAEVALFPVVGIGASAGGLDALKIFLQSLPADSGMAFVFIQHLSASHTSILPEILERISPIPVIQITDHIHIEPNRLYVVPEDKVVTATDGVLQLTARDVAGRKNDTIDIFFSSLGVIHQSYAVGIVLSGSLNDGTAGLQVIKSYGGITFAQDGGSAIYNSMPNSAVKAGVIDFILPPGKIAEQLIAINQPFRTGHSEEEIYKQILTVLRVRRGLDFQYYKNSTLKRRIIRRIAISRTETAEDYLIRLRESKAEQDALYNDMLISVTSFFRDPAVFQTITNEVFPKLEKMQYENEQSLRVWVAGCATGEEAYSMAICLYEYFGNRAPTMKLQVFATDVSEVAITKARAGIYRRQEMEGLTLERMSQFFTKLDGHYQVNKNIRDICVFAHHNLLKDPPFSKIDLLSCRNVMIYLEPVLQKRLLNTFHYALNKTGYLVLGMLEAIGRYADLFSTYRAADKIYSKVGTGGRFVQVTSFARESAFKEANSTLRKEEAEKDIFKEAEDAMLLHLIPPSVLVNEKFDIIQFKGLTDPWLQLPTGKPSFNVLKIARDSLAFELRSLLSQAKKINMPTQKYGVFFKHSGLQHFVNLQVIPLISAGEHYYLIAFIAASSIGIQPGMFEISRTVSDSSYDESSLHVEHLERELIQARADMRIISEEQESTNEKLQTYNEELLSAGEEQQSLNEELETSKEELQSINEEIIIINKELLDRNDQLNNARQYTEAIVDTIREPLLIIDRELRIKRASKSFYTRFNLNEADVENNLLYEIGDKEWDIPQLRRLLEHILPDKKIITDYKIEQEFARVGKQLIYLNARQVEISDDQQLILLAMEATQGQS